MPYTVRKWDNDEILGTYSKLAIAKRYAKGEGHTGELINERYVSIAYVANECGECVYNPHFRHVLGSVVGSLINRYDSSHF